jgi:hypothetical protein
VGGEVAGGEGALIFGQQMQYKYCYFHITLSTGVGSSRGVAADSRNCCDNSVLCVLS